jgi:hypothetical protein
MIEMRFKYSSAVIMWGPGLPQDQPIVFVSNEFYPTNTDTPISLRHFNASEATGRPIVGVFSKRLGTLLSKNFVACRLT